MNDFNFARAGQMPAGTMDTSTDEGLRKFMLGVYNKLALGILLAGVLAFVAGTVPPVTQLIFGTPFQYVVQWGPIALIFGSMFFMRNPSPVGSAILYWSIVTLLGLGLGVWVVMAELQAQGTPLAAETRGGIELVNAGYATIMKAFLITAIAFGGLSLWGYTTKKNISGFGNFMIMAMIGVFGLSIINMFMPPSSTMEWIIMGAVFVLSAGIVAWQTQELKFSYYEMAGNERGLAVMTNFGALNFFISFVNMFRIIMMFLSSRE
ncbi:Bax inhibitor-1/YccA family protein [Ponticaulis sp.]|uniref:Bax inhibitor-1/YccA family protein n=1 Tax=Ponticaulis sp. TaxID=2020902 RepID=UPI0026340980|nr:Bax inhibitor-1/YccA family protein [Ponticaulis sp.]MDF1679770.1 Bax inhibitor-1/YccA family protein [Ponticaulis sp.]